MADDNTVTEPAPPVEDTGKAKEEELSSADAAVAKLLVLRDNVEGYVPLGAPTQSIDHPDIGRTPAFRRHCWTDHRAVVWDVPESSGTTTTTTTTKIPTHHSGAVNRVKERIEQQVCYENGRGWLQHLVWQAILEETYEAWAGGGGGSTVSFAATGLLSRILHGISLAWRPGNSRTAAIDRHTRVASPGGKVAAWLESQTDVILTDENPYLYATPNVMIEWLSRKGRPNAHAVHEVLEELVNVVDDNQELPPLSSLDRRVLEELWGGEVHKYRLVVQNRQSYGLVAVKEEDTSAWVATRTKQLENAVFHPPGPDWIEQAKEQLPKPVEAMIPPEVLQEAAGTMVVGGGGRRARGTTRNIYYGSDNTYGTPKQLQEAIIKLLNERGPQTCRWIAQQLDNNVSMTRIKTALARLVWNSRQIVEHKAVCELPPPLFLTTSTTTMTYGQQVRQTELQLRRLILHHLTAVPPHKLAVAADDNDEENTIPLGWQENGHEYIGTRIVRPAVLQHETMLVEYVITGYAPPERNETGELMRRSRFRATPVDDNDDSPTVSLTDAQVNAGQHAYKERQASSNYYECHHPLSAANEIGLISGTSTTESIFGRIIGYDSIEETDGSMQHKILILPNGENTALWATLVGSTVCMVNEREYSLRLSDYEKDSPAYLECMAIIKYMQRHANGGPFLQPVDPIALGVPNYREVVKQPMDVSTVLKKLQEGSYSNPRPVHRDPVVCMLRGPFRDDVSLIFDNAMLFNPPDDWIYQAAMVLKKQVLQKIDHVCRSVSAEHQSVYIEDEFSDDDMGTATGNRKRKRRTKEDQAGAVVAEAVRFDTLKSRLPVSPKVSQFSIDSTQWQCQSKSHTELDELRLLYQQRSENSRSRTRTTRMQQTGDGPAIELEYYFDDIRASNRLQIELAQESRHERLVKSLAGAEPAYADGMPPYLGRVVAGKWEIRSERLEAALKWILRGLTASQHIVHEEAWIAPNNMYYADDTVRPFEILDKKPKKATDQQQEEKEEEEEVELSAYEQKRLQRVARNKERLESLGLV